MKFGLNIFGLSLFLLPTLCLADSLNCSDGKHSEFLLLRSSENISNMDSKAQVSVVQGKSVYDPEKGYMTSKIIPGQPIVYSSIDVQNSAMDGSIVKGTHCYAVCLGEGISWGYYIQQARLVKDNHCNE